MSKELDYITELERKNRLLGERCNQILKDKGELIDKVKELQDHLAEEVELHLHAEEYIKSLEKENAELKHNKKTVVHLADCLEEKMKERIEELEQQIEKMKRCKICKHFRWNCCSYEIRISKDCLENGMKHFELKEIEK